MFDFINEAIELTNNGFVFNGITYIFKIKAFICDVPAKSFILCTKGHTGYYSCSKCDVRGSYIAKCVAFPQQNNKLRTDAEFRNKTQAEHHNETSIIEQLPNFNMVDDFVLDPMHLLYLGVVKKLINLWCYGRPPHKLSFSVIIKISENLIHLKDQIPCEFNRKPRTLEEYKRWKATEFRQFLLYTGPLVINKLISSDLYLNFVSLHVGVTILSNKKLQPKFYQNAHQVLCYFFQTFVILYGKENASHNIHNLSHITNDSKRFGVLDAYSAFPFENFMSKILNMIRKGDKQLQQIIRRKAEMDHSLNTITHSILNNYPHFEQEHSFGPIFCTVDYQFQAAKFSNFILKNKRPDNCCSLNDGSIVIIENCIITNNMKFVVGRKFQDFSDFYTKPCLSSDLNIYTVELEDLGPLQSWNVKEINSKYILLNLENQPFIAMPLVHI